MRKAIITCPAERPLGNPLPGLDCYFQKRHFHTRGLANLFFFVTDCNPSHGVTGMSSSVYKMHTRDKHLANERPFKCVWTTHEHNNTG